jgi:hypothetical protein
MTHGSCLFLRDYYTERGTHAIGATSSGRMFFGGGALVNRQLFVIWKRRKRAAALRLSDAARALRVVSYPLSVIGKAGGDAAGERKSEVGDQRSVVVAIEVVNIDVCFEGHKSRSRRIAPAASRPSPEGSGGDIFIKSSRRAANASLLSQVIHRFFTTAEQPRYSLTSRLHRYR